MSEIFDLSSVFIPLDGPGRRYCSTREVRMGDVDPTNEIRLDAVARYGQDVANDDALDVQIPSAMDFVIRKSTVLVNQPARFRETVEITTFCNGIGSRWAGRQTRIVGDRGADIDISAVWVHINRKTGVPRKLDEAFLEGYQESALGRRVSTKLSPRSDPPTDAQTQPWPFRWSDLDLLGHVNNAAYWPAVEQVINRLGLSRKRLRVELEFRNPAPPHSRATLHWKPASPGDNNDSAELWLVDVSGSTYYATAALSQF